jgi:hypothetical protein
MKSRPLAFHAAAGLFACLAVLGCGVSRETRQIKIYHDHLGTMAGKNEVDVSAQIEKTWGFELLDSSSISTPGPERSPYSIGETRT